MFKLIGVMSFTLLSLSARAADPPFPSGHQTCEITLASQLAVDLVRGAGREFNDLKIAEKVRLLHRIADALMSAEAPVKLDPESFRKLGLILKRVTDVSDKKLAPFGDELLHIQGKIASSGLDPSGESYAAHWERFLNRVLALTPHGDSYLRTHAFGTLISLSLKRIDPNAPVPGLRQAMDYLERGWQAGRVDLILHSTLLVVYSTLHLNNLPLQMRVVLDRQFAGLLGLVGDRLRHRLRQRENEPFAHSIIMLIDQIQALQKASGLDEYPTTQHALDQLQFFPPTDTHRPN